MFSAAAQHTQSQTEEKLEIRSNPYSINSPLYDPGTPLFSSPVSQLPLSSFEWHHPTGAEPQLDEIVTLQQMEANENEELIGELNSMQTDSRIERPNTLASDDLRSVLNDRRAQSSENFVRLSVRNHHRNIRITVGNLDRYLSSFGS